VTVAASGPGPAAADVRPGDAHPVVAQLVETLEVGGAEMLAVRIANALAAAGQRAHLIVCAGPGPLSDRVDPAVAVTHLRHARASLVNPAAFAWSLRRGLNLLRRPIAAHGIEVVQTHLPGANFWGLLLQMRGVVPVIPTVHNNEEFRYGDTDNRLLLNLRKAAYRRLVRRCPATVAVSAHVRESLAADLGLTPATMSRIRVVTNGVDLPAALAADERARLRAELGAPTDAALLLAAGRLGDQKNFGDMVRVAAALRTRGVRFRLVIMGEGERRPELEEMIADLDLAAHVCLAGLRSDLRRIMQAADVFLMTSLWEGLPLVLLEAMAAGLPVVGYAVDGVREVVRDGTCGSTVAVGRYEDFADAVRALLTDEERRRNQGRASREIVAREYSFDRTVAALRELYDRASRPVIETVS